jgi:hypothetical protein
MMRIVKEVLPDMKKILKEIEQQIQRVKVVVMAISRSIGQRSLENS